MVDYEVNVKLIPKGLGQFKRNIQEAVKSVPMNLKNIGGKIGGAVTSPETKQVAQGIGKSVVQLAKIGAILGFIKIGWDKLQFTLGKWSPLLSAQIDIAKKSFMLALLPIADTLAVFLQPLTNAFLKFASWWYVTGKQLLSNIGNKIEKVTGGIVQQRAPQGIIGGAIAGGFVGSQVGGLQALIVGSLIGAITGLLTSIDYSKLKEAITSFADNFPKNFDEWKKKIDDVTPAVEKFASEISQTMLDLTQNFIVGLSGALGSLVGSFAKWFIDVLKNFFNGVMETAKAFIKDPLGVLANLGTWLWDSIKNALSKKMFSLTNLGFWLWKTITEAISSAITSFKRSIGIISQGTRQLGGDIQKTGLYRLHAGETIIPAGAGTSTFSPTLNITVSGGNNIDERKLANDIMRMMEREYRTYKRG